MKEKKKYIIIISIMFIMVLLLAFQTYQKNTFDHRQMNVESYEIAEKQRTIDIEKLVDHQIIEEQFKAKYDNLETVILTFQPADERIANEYYPTYKTTASIKIKEMNTGNIIAEKTLKNFDLIQIINNQYSLNEKYSISFEKQKDSKGKEYSITIEYDIQDDLKDVFLPYYYPEKEYEGAKWYIGGEEQNGTLRMQANYDAPEKAVVFITIIMMIASIILGLLMYINRKKELTPEKTFLYIMTPMMILMFLFTPMGMAHDEMTHFYREYEISQGIWLTPIKDGKSDSYIPKSIIELSDESIETSPKEKVTTITDAVYSPIQFIGATIGIKIADIFSNNAIILAYAGRITNIILCFLLLYFSIKIIPFGKKILLLFMMIPISIEGMISLSPDGMTLAIIYFFIAYVLKLAFDEKRMVKGKDIGFLIILSIIISQCKITYLPIVGLLLLIPYRKFTSKKQKNILIGIAWSLSILASLAWLGIAGSYMVEFNGGIGQINRQWLIEHPITFVGYTLHTMSTNMGQYLISSFGGNLFWGELVQYTIFPLLLCFLSIGIAVGDEKLKNKFSSFQKVIMILVILAIVGLVFMSEFLTWTMPGTNEINGIQGRYFIPILPILFLLIGNIKFKNEYSETDILKTIAIAGLLTIFYVLGSLAMYII